MTRSPSASFTRPDNTDAYASGDIVANSATAGSVVPLSLGAGSNGASIEVLRARLRKSGASITNSAFRIHLFRDLPVFDKGDNGVFATGVSGVSSYLGAIDVTVGQAFDDGAAGFGAPSPALRHRLAAGASILYAVVEARGAYTPAAEEVFTVTLDIQDA